MKNLLTAVLLQLSLCLLVQQSVAQSHINSLIPPTRLTDGASSDIRNKLDDLKRKVSDSEAKRKIQALIERLATLDDAIEITKAAEEIGDQSIVDQLNTITKGLRDGAVDPVSFSGDLILKPAPGKGDATLTPSITGDYKFNKAIGLFIGDVNVGYDVHVQLQPPTAATDTSTIVRNILSSGGDGSVQVSAKAGFGDSWESGFRLSLQGGLSWLSERTLDTTHAPGFAFGTGSCAMTVWFNPIAVSYQMDFRAVSNFEANPLAQEINRSMSGSLLVAVKLQNDLFLQVKYLLASNKAVSNGESFEIRFVKAFSPF
jgi:hypothetical protein